MKAAGSLGFATHISARTACVRGSGHDCIAHGATREDGAHVLSVSELATVLPKYAFASVFALSIVRSMLERGGSGQRALLCPLQERTIRTSVLILPLAAA